MLTMDWLIPAIAVLAVWNTIVFDLYGVDKRRAKRGGRRISERTLLLAAALMGGLGALLGMHLFRHKTEHTRFKLGVPLLLIVHIAVVFFTFGGFDVKEDPGKYSHST